MNSDEEFDDITFADRYEVWEATREAIDAAELPPETIGVQKALLRIARAIDDIDGEGLNPAGKLDNVSIPTYLKYSEALGLTVKPAKGGGDGGGEEKHVSPLAALAGKAKGA